MPTALTREKRALDSANAMPALGFWRRSCALAIATASLVAPASAEDPLDPRKDTAAETPEDSSDGEPIPVTGGEAASKYLDALSAAGEFQALRIDDIDELSNFTPNLEIHDGPGAPSATLFIRGIGLMDYEARTTGPVAVYHDGVNLNSPAIQLDQLFDLERIDVLRGPQGSLNAHNATAGALLLRSALPSGEFGVSTNLTYGNYDDVEIEAAVDVPLIEDVLSMRVSGTARWRDGYTKNQCAGWNPEAHGFRRVDQQANEQLYAELRPAGTYENGELRPVLIQPQRGGAVQPAFVYLNYDLAEEARTYSSGIITFPRSNPYVLAEDIYDANGMLVAQAGDRVARQGNLFFIDDVDGICTVRPPGQIVSTLGAFQSGGANPEFTEGNWLSSNRQPSLAEFSDLERWTNDIDKWAARMVLLFEPLDNMEWTLNAHGAQNRGDSAHLQMLGADAKFSELGFEEKTEADFSENNAALIALANGAGDLGEGIRNVRGIDPNFAPGEGGGNPYSGFYSSDGIESVDAWGINGRGFWDLGSVVLSLLYGYEWFERIIEDEGDANPSRVFPSVRSDRAWQASVEPRIEGGGDRYHWTAGFFYLYEELDANDYRPHPTTQFETDQGVSQTLTSWAPYATGEVDLVEEGVIPGLYALTLDGGVRFNHEKKKFSLMTSVRGPSSIPEFEWRLPEVAESETWKEVTGDATLSYTPFSNDCGSLLSYLRYSRGFKGGNFNEGLTITGGEVRQAIVPLDPELVDALEFGLRSRWFGERLILDAAVFRYWYRGLAVFDVTNEAGTLPTRKLHTADADVLGAEAELQLRPLPGLLISANFGWLDSEYDDFIVTKFIGVPRGPPTPQDFDYSGNSLAGAPTWNFAGIAEFELPLFGWGSLIPHWDVNWRSKAYFDPQMLDPISQDGYWLHNARISYRTPGERIELTFWIANIFDEEYKRDAFDITREFNTILEAWGEPRTYGVTLSLNW